MHYICAVYGEPIDADQFRKHYLETHLPLARYLPGLVDMHYSFDVAMLGPDPQYFCVWTGTFEDADAAAAAMQAPEGQAVAADVPNFASGGVTLFQYSAESFPK